MIHKRKQSISQFLHVHPSADCDVFTKLLLQLWHHFHKSSHVILHSKPHNSSGRRKTICIVICRYTLGQCMPPSPCMQVVSQLTALLPWENWSRYKQGCGHGKDMRPGVSVHRFWLQLLATILSPLRVSQVLVTASNIQHGKLITISILYPPYLHFITVLLGTEAHTRCDYCDRWHW